jgi:hypothetical protein
MFRPQRVIIRCYSLHIQLLNCNFYIYVCLHVLLKWLEFWSLVYWYNKYLLILDHNCNYLTNIYIYKCKCYSLIIVHVDCSTWRWPFVVETCSAIFQIYYVAFTVKLYRLHTRNGMRTSNVKVYITFFWLVFLSCIKIPDSHFKINNIFGVF